MLIGDGNYKEKITMGKRIDSQVYKVIEYLKDIKEARTPDRVLREMGVFWLTITPATLGRKLRQHASTGYCGVYKRYFKIPDGPRIVKFGVKRSKGAK